jgi:hypothetical protein
LTNTDQQYQTLLLIFRQYLDSDAELVAAINAFGESFLINSFGWLFTLPDLFKFSCQQNQSIQELEYKQFRKLLYENPTNQLIGEINGRFEIVEDRGHIDKNLYRLFT